MVAGEKKIEAFYDLIAEIVDSPGPWKVKRDALIRMGTSEQQGKLREFVDWFADGDI